MPRTEDTLIPEVRATPIPGLPVEGYRALVLAAAGGDRRAMQVLLNGDELADLFAPPAAQFEEATRGRAVIDRARGVLMASRPGLSPEEAFAELVGASRRQGVELVDIAARIVEHAASSWAGKSQE